MVSEARRGEAGKEKVQDWGLMMESWSVEGTKGVCGIHCEYSHGNDELKNQDLNLARLIFSGSC